MQLGGEPDFDPTQLTARSHSEYRTGQHAAGGDPENLVAERIAIDSYREMIQYIGDSDPTTRRMLEEILAVEEEHADDLADLLDASRRRRSETRPRRAAGSQREDGAGAAPSAPARAARGEARFGDAARLRERRLEAAQQALAAAGDALPRIVRDAAPASRGPSPSLRANGRGSGRCSWSSSPGVESHPAAALAQRGNFLDAGGQYGTVDGHAVGRLAVGTVAAAQRRRSAAGAESSITRTFTVPRIASRSRGVFRGESGGQAAGEAYCEEVLHGHLPWSSVHIGDAGQGAGVGR